ncbi:MAG TPA: hypothetical protein VLK82_04845 [Candidatus Tectomicrobia bacterium]|nr:hypothetical protein [Candidatus Tectomicrobia bacterium]
MNGRAVRRGLVVLGLISYATGTLLGGAFLGMTPPGFQQAPTTAIITTTLAGLDGGMGLYSSTRHERSHPDPAADRVSLG